MNKYQKYKPRAVKFSESEGYFTIYCHNPALAFKLLKEAVDEDEEINDEEDRITVEIEDVKEEVMYRCKHCDFMTVGDSTCCECGETLYSYPRQTFVFYSPR